MQIDEQQTKQERLEFLGATANFLREAVPAGQQVPEMIPAIMGMIQFGIAGFKQARQLEGVFDTALQKMVAKAAQNEANPKPDPKMQQEQVKAQAAQQQQAMEQQHTAQVEQIRAQANAQLEQVRMFAQMQLQRQEQQHEAMMSQMEQRQEENYKRWEAQLKAATAIEVAESGKSEASTTANIQADAAEVAAEKRVTESLA